MTEESQRQPNAVHQGGQRKTAVTHTYLTKTHTLDWGQRQSRGLAKKHSFSVGLCFLPPVSMQTTKHIHVRLSHKSWGGRASSSSADDFQHSSLYKEPLKSNRLSSASPEVLTTIMESEARTFPHIHTWRSHFYWHNTFKGIRPGWGHLARLWKAKRF